MIVYVSIGNSDDKLTQADWSDFYWAVDELLRKIAHPHGAWQSVTSARWQNACWCIEVADDDDAKYLRDHLIALAAKYHQDSIAWAEAKDTEFLGSE